MREDGMQKRARRLVERQVPMFCGEAPQTRTISIYGEALSRATIRDMQPRPAPKAHQDPKLAKDSPTY
jgi:hypothetical protein